MRCESSVVPSVAVTSAWVSPRVKSAEPCTRGRTPVSIVILRISSKARWSGRMRSLSHLLAEDLLAECFVVLASFLLASASPAGSSFVNSSLISLTMA